MRLWRETPEVSGPCYVHGLKPIYHSSFFVGGWEGGGWVGCPY